jgi:hypothetical protein
MSHDRDGLVMLSETSHGGRTDNRTDAMVQIQILLLLTISEHARL